MIHILRKNQRGLMLGIAVLTIIAFIFLYNRGPLDDIAATQNPKIYGQALNQGVIDKQVRNYRLTMMLGQYNLLLKLGGRTADQSAAVSEFVWNLLVLQHQARALGVEPTDAQVADRIKGLPVFQADGQFDPLKYGAFVRDQLAPLGFTERQLEEVMRDALRLDRIEAIVAAPIAIGEAELRETARVLQPVTADFVRFQMADAAAGVTVSPEDVSAYFERNKANLNTTETRAVRYVTFELPMGTKLEGRAKVDALQKLVGQATEFVDAISSTPFDQAATAAGLTVRSTPAFDRTGNLAATIQAGPDTANQLQDLLAKVAPKEVLTAIAPQAFLLPGVGKASDALQVGDSFYVIELSELTPVRPLTLAEATPDIETRLREVKAEAALKSSATEKIQALRTAVAAGKPFAEAAKEAGLSVESLDAVAPMSESLTPEQRRVISTTLALKDGELSRFEPAPWGGFAVFLKSRGPLADADLAAKRDEIREGLLQNKRELLFAEWLRTAREEANIRIPSNSRK